MSGPRVGYVLRKFPQLSETFITNEIVGLERLGLSVCVFSYLKPTERIAHESLRLLQSQVAYLPDPLFLHPLDLLAAHRAVRRAWPEGYANTMRYALRQTVATRAIDPWLGIHQAVCLARLLQENEVYRLHAQMAHGATRLAMLTSMLTGLPFSFTAHARDVYRTNPDRLRERIAAADFVVVCNGAAREHLQRIARAEDRDKLLLEYHGVDVEKFSPARRATNVGEPVVLSAGRLVEKKGFDVLLRACALLKERGVSFRCVIVGGGPERGRLEKLIRELGLGSAVSLPGACSQEELIDRYSAATVFALPCVVLDDGDRDGIPNVLVEAMAMGLPVVSTAISGIPELVRSGENGLLVGQRDAHALASALELLLRDATLRERLGASARATVTARFDASNAAQQLAALFREGAPRVGELSSVSNE